MARQTLLERAPSTASPSKTHISRRFPFAKYQGVYDKIDTVKISVEGTQLTIPKKVENFIKESLESEFLECNFSRAKLFRDKYGIQNRDAGDYLFREKTLELLAKVKQILDDLSVPFWLSSGTCLGYFRQCDVIPYSKDVDIGIFIKDFHPLLIQMLTSHGLALKHYFGKPNDSFELSFSYDDIKLDIFFFYEESEYIWNGGTQAKTGKKFKYKFPKFHLCWTEFFNLKVRIPCETESYIEANYGKNWFEPVKTWDWKQSPNNVEENGVWPKEEWPKVIRLYEPSSDTD